MVRASAVVAALALMGPAAAWHGGAAAPWRKGRLASSSAHERRYARALAPSRLALRADAGATGTPLVNRLNQAESERFAPGSGVVTGHAHLVDERDACGVGFVAQPGDASHAVVQKALGALGCMEHRGACAADNKSGDGAGLLTEVPWPLLARDCPALQVALDAGRPVGLGMLFLDRDADRRAAAKALVETQANEAGFDVVGWRAVPVDPDVLGSASAATVPVIEQAFFAPCPRLLGADGTFGGLGFGDDWGLLGGTQADDGKVHKPLPKIAARSEGLERALYLLRRKLRGASDDANLGMDALYVASLSSRTVTYKGMVRSVDLARFYADLADPLFVSRFAIYHRRFSTNTAPRWPLAQPMRMLGHNGEINTLLGNVNWMRARAGAQAQCDIGDLLDLNSGGGLSAEGLARCDTSFAVELGPLVDTKYSDSANLDSVFELYAHAGRSAAEALMLMVPQAYENGRVDAKEDKLLAFHQFHAPLQEAWDGPALLVFTDGDSVGAALDRNGLRPARFTRLQDGTVYLMSETGVVPLDEAQVVEKGRLGPGQMVSVDLASGAFHTDADHKQTASESQDWPARLAATQAPLPRHPFQAEPSSAGPPLPSAAPYVPPASLVAAQTAFGWGAEDVAINIADMARTGIEATFSMGDDAPLAALSSRPHVPFDYLRQLFAQVTNPPIDSIREGEVMSLGMSLGRRGHALNGANDDAATSLLIAASPVLDASEMQALKNPEGRVATTTLSTLYPRPVVTADESAAAASLRQGDTAGLGAALASLTQQAVEMVRDGADVLVLSDLSAALDATTLYVPPLLAVGAVHHALIDAGLRMKASLVVETGQCWTTHHVACLVGFGASAVHPYLAYDVVSDWQRSPAVQAMQADGRMPPLSEAQALNNFRKGLEKGLLKILSKMGISLLASYHGGQIFEALGLGGDLVEGLGAPLRGTPSRVGGLDTADVGRELLVFCDRAFPAAAEEKAEEVAVKPRLVDDGFVKPKGSKEHHSNSPQLAKVLHKAVRTKDTEAFNAWSSSLNGRPLTALRDLLELGTAEDAGRTPVPLDEVEPVEDIMQRFCTGGMSLGALSRECHETLAVALNRIGGKSNSGEGGEDRVRAQPLAAGDVDPSTGVSATLPHLKPTNTGGLVDGDHAGSSIKQVASGRFGVTPAYLVSAAQIEIKIAQGAKPGEGGQLPGPKVSQYIAEVRGATPGVTLISPPPHHDIYSIEDLAQLIFDLKAVNPTAKVSVKLVAEPGIGTVAAGVVKANADVVQVSGHDGGTGASPLSSIKHAGSSWELGLAEAHRTLVLNGLRKSALLRVDGGLRTGLDVTVAALLGAEEFGFGTVAMVAAGCVMARVCHLNTCPVGVCTQKPELRAKFPGCPDDVVNYFAFVAEEVRWHLAALGCRSVDEAVGLGASLLKPKANARPFKTTGLTTAFLTDLPTQGLDGVAFAAPSVRALAAKPPRPHSEGAHFDDRAGLLTGAVAACVASNGESDVGLTVEAEVANTDRAVATMLSGLVARTWGNAGLPQGALNLRLTGSAGQSLGAFLVPGVEVRLEGEANDYVGKGMHGGSIALVPPTALASQPHFAAESNVICGNTCLYGATGGNFFARGRAGERFAVRNSGARAVIEGAGDHCCEYMTNGVVAVLGPVSRSVGAGMTGGLAFFLADDDTEEGKGFPAKVSNDASVQRVTSAGGLALLHSLLTEHHAATDSANAASLLAEWPASAGRFWQVVPLSEKHNPAVVDPPPAAAAAAKKEVVAAA